MLVAAGALFAAAAQAGTPGTQRRRGNTETGYQGVGAGGRSLVDS